MGLPQAGQDDRATRWTRPRHPVDDHIEERADRQAQKGTEPDQQSKHARSPACKSLLNASCRCDEQAAIESVSSPAPPLAPFQLVDVENQILRRRAVRSTAPCIRSRLRYLVSRKNRRGNNHYHPLVRVYSGSLSLGPTIGKTPRHMVQINMDTPSSDPETDVEIDQIFMVRRGYFPVGVCPGMVYCRWNFSACVAPICRRAGRWRCVLGDNHVG